MREIKFRAVDFRTGERVYAELGRVVLEADKYYTFFLEDEHTVDPDSIEEYIATDANGREIYENDLIIRVKDYEQGKQWPLRATLADYEKILEGKMILARAGK